MLNEKCVYVDGDVLLQSEYEKRKNDAGNESSFKLQYETWIEYQNWCEKEAKGDFRLSADGETNECWCGKNRVWSSKQICKDEQVVDKDEKK